MLKVLGKAKYLSVLTSLLLILSENCRGCTPSYQETSRSDLPKSQTNPSDYPNTDFVGLVKPVDPVDSVEEVKSVDPVEEVKSVDPVKEVKSVDPVKEVKSVGLVEEVKSVGLVEEVKPVGLVEEVKSIIKKHVKPCLIWLHGMFEDNSGWEEVINKIINTSLLSDRMQTIFPTSRIKKVITAWSSVFDQANRVVQHIKEEIEKRLRYIIDKHYPHWPEEKKRAVIKLGIKYVPVLLGGFSQGGRVAVDIGYNNEEQINYGLNIKGIVCVQTPLSGVNPFTKGGWDVIKFLYGSKGAFAHMGIPFIPCCAKMAASKLGVNFSDFLWRCGRTTAIQDMNPDSESTQHCFDFIRKNKNSKGKNHNIPILLMCGYIQDLLRYFPHVDKVKLFEQGLDKLLDGTFTDGSVSIESQLCRNKDDQQLDNSSLNNLQHIIPNNPDNVYVYISPENTFHGRNKAGAAFVTFDHLGSKEMFDYEEPKDKLAKFCADQIDKWKDEE